MKALGCLGSFVLLGFAAIAGYNDAIQGWIAFVIWIILTGVMLIESVRG